MIAGLGGSRYLLILFMPICLSALWELLSTKSSKALRWGLLSTGFALVGYYINGNILSKYFSFDNYNNVYFINIKEEDLGERLIKITSGVLNDIFGYCNNARLFSLQGINNGCVIICVFLILITSVKVYKKNCTLFVKFIISSIMANGVALLFLSEAFSSDVFVSRYYGPVLIYAFLLVPLWGETTDDKFKRYFGLLTLVSTMLFISFANSYRLVNIDLNKDRKGALEYLENAEITFGYASFWNANITTELTDGKVKVQSVYDFEMLNSMNYLSYKEYSKQDYSTNVCFILMTMEEFKQYASTNVISNGIIGYEDEYFVICLYPDSETIFNLVKGGQL